MTNVAPAGRRRCPICGGLTDRDLCPADRMATLLVGAAPSDPTRIRVGDLIAGRYEIEKVVGRGGFGAVFQARHTGTGQGVALKVLAAGGDDDELALQRFFVEARVTSGLRHPNTVRVFDFGQDDDGLVYLAMELLHGHTLKQELRARRREGRVFTEKEAVEIGIAVSRSLGEAHMAGVVHRDLKPDNVFLHHVEGDDPVIKVLDFGIVKLAHGGVNESASEGGPGTPAFMSPEQCLNKPDLDGRSDLYALGVILWQLVCGKVPLRGDTEAQTLYMHVHTPPPDLRTQARVPLSTGFVELVEQALAKRKEDRFPDAATMRESLRECLDQSRHNLILAQLSYPQLAIDPEADDLDHATVASLPSPSEAAFAPPLAGRYVRARAGSEAPRVPGGRLGPWLAIVAVFVAAVGIGLLWTRAERPGDRTAIELRPEPSGVATPPPAVEPPTTGLGALEGAAPAAPEAPAPSVATAEPAEPPSDEAAAVEPEVLPLGEVQEAPPAEAPGRAAPDRPRSPRKERDRPRRGTPESGPGGDILDVKI